MIRKLNFKACLAGALSTFILNGTARAQTAPAVPDPAQQYFAHVSIQAAPSTELVVVPQGAPPGSAAVARCVDYCDFWALPGKYTVYSRHHTTGARKELTLRVKQSSRFVLHVGDDEDRQAGLVLGVSGSIALGAGLVMVGLAGLSESQGTAAAGLGLLVVGGIATPIGWSMFSSNRTRLKRIDVGLNALPEPRRELRVGVVGVGLGGLGLGGVATF